uniref:Uncharacterized protein n=1 Tax=Lotus japonicus TaxID=34305 RepID=I3T4I8_LOTJA|nr:unknown [Lotus japonicus]
MLMFIQFARWPSYMICYSLCSSHNLYIHKCTTYPTE